MGDDRTPVTLARRGELRLATDPVCGMKVDPRSARGGSFAHGGTTYFFCSPGCRERFAKDPDHWLKAGPRASAMTRCRARPGPGPAARPEPRGGVDLPDGPGGGGDGSRRVPDLRHGARAEAVTAAAAPNPELEDMRRRLRVSAALTLPLLLLAMGAMLPGHLVGRFLSPRAQGLVELLLATPVVLWGGRPFFERMLRELPQPDGSTCSR